MSQIKYLLEKLKESLTSTLPIFFVVLIFFILQKCNVFAPMSNPTYEQYLIKDEHMISFGIATALIIIGMAFFNLGTEQSMMEIGSIVGGSLTKKGKLLLIIAMSFILGVFVTIAEPDLSVLAGQIGIDKIIIIAAIGVGVGIFLVVGVLRVLFKKGLNIMFIAFYGLAFLLAYLINPRFLPICFDSGGVTTGPVTVPFILGFGAGLAASKASGKSGEDSFGFTALCSVGPIIAVIIISLFLGDLPSDAASIEGILGLDALSAPLGTSILNGLLGSAKEVGIAIVPVLLFFIVYELIFIKLPLKRLIKILIGILYAYFGLTLFLGSVSFGFLPVAKEIGMAFGSSSAFFPIALGCGALFGVFGVLAEPAVHVLTRQIEVVSEGNIKAKTVLGVLAIAIGSAVVLHLIRAYYQFSIIYYLVPGYLLAIALTFCVPKIYTAMAFDSGGVASGPMTSTFILPFCIGFSYSHAQDIAPSETPDIYMYGFGLVSLVAMMPLIVVQLLGLTAEFKHVLMYNRARKRIVEEDDDQIIHLGQAFGE